MGEWDFNLQITRLTKTHLSTGDASVGRRKPQQLLIDLKEETEIALLNIDMKS